MLSHGIKCIETSISAIKYTQKSNVITAFGEKVDQLMAVFAQLGGGESAAPSASPRFRGEDSSPSPYTLRVCKQEKSELTFMVSNGFPTTTPAIPLKQTKTRSSLSSFYYIFIYALIRTCIL